MVLFLRVSSRGYPNWRLTRQSSVPDRPQPSWLHKRLPLTAWPRLGADAHGGQSFISSPPLTGLKLPSIPDFPPSPVSGLLAFLLVLRPSYVA